MKEGLLWFDNDPAVQLADKIKQAADRYRARLNRRPTVCYLNIDQFDEKVAAVNGIELKPAAYIRPNYLWIGVENEPPPAKVA